MEFIKNAEHVKTHRFKKKSVVWKFITDCNEKTDELGTEGARLDGGNGTGESKHDSAGTAEGSCSTAMSNLLPLFCGEAEWKDCEELGPRPREKSGFRKQKGKQRSIARSCVRQQTNVVARDAEEAATT